MARNLAHYTGTSAADTNQTVSAPPAGSNSKLKVLRVIVAYSASPTQTGVVITLDSAHGSGFDTTLITGTANTRYTYWVPDGELILDSFINSSGTQVFDQLNVLAPQAGGAVTSSVEIQCEVA